MSLAHEDVDPTQVRHVSREFLYALTLKQPVVYIPCDETSTGV
jgi:hypothetical protein